MYILLKNLDKKYLRVHISLHGHSNRIYKAKEIEETEKDGTKKQFIAEGVIWPERTIKKIFSYKEIEETYPEYLL